MVSMSFRLVNVAGRAALLDAQDQWFDLETASGGVLPSDPMTAITRHGELHAVAAALERATPGGHLAGADLQAPVPTPRQSFAVGLNYRNHAAESQMEPPSSPLVFAKFPSCIVGPSSDVQLNTHAGDYEVELVVVIGAQARNVDESAAWSYVAGVTGGQDISDRHLQFAAQPPHFDLGKSRETYGPIGPALVSVDALADRDAVPLRCWVNGELRQDGNTRDLIFSVPRLVAYLSSILTLYPGDVIFTGTPEGVGAASGRFLSPGDLVESDIDGVGRLTNRCR
jgi:2,4-didehydro-3-deoxy-L-rhamnonate hydrolase